ncbi:unnamed protein product [Knipowitschia caucasica]
MASGSGPSHSAFGLGRKKKSPGLMDQISKIFAGDKKKRSKGSFRGHTSPQTSSTRRKPNENAVVKFFRSLVASSPRPKSRWRDALGLASSSKAEGAKSPVQRRRKQQGTLSRLLSLGETKSRPPPKRWSTIF